MDARFTLLVLDTIDCQAGLMRGTYDEAADAVYLHIAAPLAGHFRALSNAVIMVGSSGLLFDSSSGFPDLTTVFCLMLGEMFHDPLWGEFVALAGTRRPKLVESHRCDLIEEGLSRHCKPVEMYLQGLA